MFFTDLAISIPAMALPVADLNLVTSPNNVGDTFDVEVLANADNSGLGLLSFGFDLTFDQGGIFSYTGYTLNSKFFDTSLGTNNVAGMTFPAISDNSVLLTTLSFATLSTGTDTLNVKGFYDGGFYGLYYTLPGIGYDIDKSLTITVGSSSTGGTSPVPEPATMLLFGTGLAGFVGTKLRRKKK